MSAANIPTIGLDGEQRSDHELRAAFPALFALLTPYMDAQGQWLSNIHEAQALDALAAQYPEIAGMRQFAVLARIANVRAEGRTPT